MTAYTPQVRVLLGSDSGYIPEIAYDIVINAGRESVTDQAQPGYTTITLWRAKSNPVKIGLGGSAKVQITNSAGAWVTIYTGYITDLDVSVENWGNVGFVYAYKIGTVATMTVLTRRNAGYAGYPKQLDGERVKAILKEALLTSWTRVSATIQWSQVLPTLTWETYDAASASYIEAQIDNGVYELEAYSGGPAPACDLVREAANSGRGVLYCLADGTIAYDDYVGRYSLTPVAITADMVDPYALTTSYSMSDIVNSVEVTYRAGSEYAKDEASIAQYGELQGTRTTTLHNQSSAITQAADFLSARAWANVGGGDKTLLIDLINPALSDATRDALIGTTMAMEVSVTGIAPPFGSLSTPYLGFVESYTWKLSKGHAEIELHTSARTQTYPSYIWAQILPTYTWTSYGTANPTQKWQDIA